MNKNARKNKKKKRKKDLSPFKRIISSLTSKSLKLIAFISLSFILLISLIIWIIVKKRPARRAEMFPIGDYSDLGIGNISLIEKKLQARTFKIKYVVKNQGRVATTDSFKIKITANGKDYFQQTSNLDPDWPKVYREITLDQEFSLDEKINLTITADSGDTVEEIDEDNNSRSWTLPAWPPTPSSCTLADSADKDFCLLDSHCSASYGKTGYCNDQCWCETKDAGFYFTCSDNDKDDPYTTGSTLTTDHKYNNTINRKYNDECLDNGEVKEYLCFQFEGNTGIWHESAQKVTDCDTREEPDKGCFQYFTTYPCPDGYHCSRGACVEQSTNPSSPNLLTSSFPQTIDWQGYQWQVVDSNSYCHGGGTVTKQGNSLHFSIPKGGEFYDSAGYGGAVKLLSSKASGDFRAEVEVSNLNASGVLNTSWAKAGIRFWGDRYKMARIAFRRGRPDWHDYINYGQTSLYSQAGMGGARNLSDPADPFNFKAEDRITEPVKLRIERIGEEMKMCYKIVGRKYDCSRKTGKDKGEEGWRMVYQIKIPSLYKGQGDIFLEAITIGSEVEFETDFSSFSLGPAEGGFSCAANANCQGGGNCSCSSFSDYRQCSFQAADCNNNMADGCEENLLKTGGQCPSPSPASRTRTGGSADFSTAGSSPSPSPSPSSSPSPSPSPQPSPSPSPLTITSPSPSASPEVAITLDQEISLDIKLKFAGVPANNNDINLPQEQRKKEVRIIFEKQEGGQTSYFTHYQNFDYQPSDKSYQASFSLGKDQLPSGNYNLLIKGPVHRQIRFCRNEQTTKQSCSLNNFISLTPGQSYFLDFSNYPLEFGDVDWGGSVGVEDYSFAKACKDQDSHLGDLSYQNGCFNADGNFDGVCDITDIDLLYKTVSDNPDDNPLY